MAEYMDGPFTPDEAVARIWNSEELAAYMMAFGLPAPGRLIMCKSAADTSQEAE